MFENSSLTAKRNVYQPLKCTDNQMFFTFSTQESYKILDQVNKAVANKIATTFFGQWENLKSLPL